MKIKHSFKKVEAEPQVETYAQERLERINRFLLKDGAWNVVYSRPSRHEFLVETVLKGPQGTFKASARSQNFFESVDLVVDKLSAQIIKSKERVRSHKNFALSKEGQLARVNDRFEYAPVALKKPA